MMRTFPTKLLLLLSSLMLIMILATSGSVLEVDREQQQQQQQWCVASDKATDEGLQEALDWACSTQGGANCSSIQPSGICFLPNTLKDHASFAFNDYWQKFKGQGGTCDFKGSALLVHADPSHDLCAFPLLP
ncbi:uncharacterized protein A4U43_C06F20180 [Asparagus officinalis]|uniref:X8 domain-containing protein n=1 Tax=Asparagus officinalis TaxID=4686 RepID=A0A5P1ES88_ASPOF|nr:glucan endo-1,3-beta-glucosidase 4-like [Asparagus officinalis]ONK67431.1 uncharacterized protein A4U43_C06F20180 [Asparagus officinalis]